MKTSTSRESLQTGKKTYVFGVASNIRKNAEARDWEGQAWESLEENCLLKFGDNCIPD